MGKPARSRERGVRFVSFRTACGFSGPRDRRAFARAMGGEDLHTKLRDWEAGASANPADLLAYIQHIAADSCQFIDEPVAVATWILMGGEMPKCMRVRLGYDFDPEGPSPGGGLRREGEIIRLEDHQPPQFALDAVVVADPIRIRALASCAQQVVAREAATGHVSPEICMLAKRTTEVLETTVFPEDDMNAINSKKWLICPKRAS